MFKEINKTAKTNTMIEVNCRAKGHQLKLWKNCVASNAQQNKLERP